MGFRAFKQPKAGFGVSGLGFAVLGRESSRVTGLGQRAQKKLDP